MFFILLANKFPEVIRVEPWTWTICEERVICLCSMTIGMLENYCLEKNDFQVNAKDVINKVGCFY